MMCSSLRSEEQDAFVSLLLWEFRSVLLLFGEMETFVINKVNNPEQAKVLMNTNSNVIFILCFSQFSSIGLV